MKLFIVSGEPSGDVHAANLVRELSKHTELEIFGTGGEHLAALGQKQLYTIKQLAAIGFVGALKIIPFLLKVAKVLQREIETVKPDIILLVDYSGFNLRFAKKLKKYNIPVVELVAPQVWIWNYSRVKILAKYFDKVLCILPFEENLLRGEGVNAVYIGHPVTETLKVKSPDRAAFFEKHDLDPAKPLVGLVPGSRPREIKALSPVMGEAVERFGAQFQYVAARADSVAEADLKALLPDGVSILTGETQDIMKYSDLLWICSGTATLEAAILGTPMIIMYTSSELDFFIMKILTKLRMVGLPNIILKYAAMPELLGRHMTADALVDTTDEMFSQLSIYRERLVPLAQMFEGRTPMKTAAEEILKSAKRL